MICNDSTLSLQILTVARFQHRTGTYSVNARPYAALAFRISGTSHFELSQKSISSNQGDVLYIPANTPYRVEYSPNDIIVVHLSHCS